MKLILLPLLSASCFAIGNILQKKGLVTVDTKCRSIKSFIILIIQNIHWWLGILISALAIFLYYYALSFGNLTLIQPLMVFNPILSTILGILFFKENLNIIIFFALLLSMTGIVLVSLQSYEKPGDFYFNKWLFSLICCIIIISIYYIRGIDAEFRFSLIAGIGFGISSIVWKSLMIEAAQEAIGSRQLQIQIIHFLTSPLLWFFCSTYIVGFVASQIALTKGRVIIVVPLSGALGLVIPMIGGIILFQEYVLPIRIAGIILIFIGCFLFVPVFPGNEINR